MDKARIATIWAELKQYGDETQLGFPLSTIKVGELAELISENAGYADTIERQAKEISEHREHIGDLQGRLWSVKETRDHLRTLLSEAQDTYQKTYDDLAAAKAEVELLRSQIDNRATSVAS